jgi:hypothetical protein
MEDRRKEVQDWNKETEKPVTWHERNILRSSVLLSLLSCLTPYVMKKPESRDVRLDDSINFECVS